MTTQTRELRARVKQLADEVSVLSAARADMARRQGSFSGADGAAFAQITTLHHEACQQLLEWQARLDAETSRSRFALTRHTICVMSDPDQFDAENCCEGQAACVPSNLLLFLDGLERLRAGEPHITWSGVTVTADMIPDMEAALEQLSEENRAYGTKEPFVMSDWVAAVEDVEREISVARTVAAEAAAVAAELAGRFETKKVIEALTGVRLGEGESVYGEYTWERKTEAEGRVRLAESALRELRSELRATLEALMDSYVQ